jgi:hypothetical protein
VITGLCILLALAAGFDYSPWDRVLKRFVNAVGEVDYAAIRAEPAPIDAYLAAIASVSPDSHPQLFASSHDQLAYWLNAYNALVTKGVADAYPTKGVRHLGADFAFFKRAVYVAGNRRVSLDNIEHDTIRKRFAEPRIHFALVCASVSCPRLDRDAFLPATLDAHLDRLTRQFLSERRNLLIDAARNRITLSSLFKWYGADFQSVPAFLARYVPAVAALRNPRLRYFEYDWSINEPGSRHRSASPFERELAAGPPN